MSESFWFDYNNQRYVGNTPDTCPLCHVRVHIDAGRDSVLSNGYLQHLFQCPSCHDLFIGYYSLHEHAEKRSVHDLGKLQLEILRPSRPRLEEVSDSIQAISPSFVQIYNEAITAKEMELSQIAGPGFRKAVEFLIKDYAKTKVEDEEGRKAIEKAFVGAVVSKFIGDPRIQDVAKRALWLGNDETHYLRQWTDHDIKDLIALIRLTIHWIEMELLASKYKHEMPDEKLK